jgi:hypothetical protein
MKLQSTKILELMESRLELLRALIRAEGEWRSAFIALNLSDAESRTADQELICGRIRALDKEITLLQAEGREVSSSGRSGVDPVIDPGIRAAQDRMAALHEDLKQSNRTKQAILKRSKFTINALQNLFNSYAPTYAAPAAPSTGTIYEGNV